MTLGEIETVKIPKGYELVVVKIHDPDIVKADLEWCISLQNPAYHIWERKCKNLYMTDAFIKHSTITLQHIVDDLYKKIQEIEHDGS